MQKKTNNTMEKAELTFQRTKLGFELDHNDTVEQLFEKLVQEGIQFFKKHGGIVPCAHLIIRNFTLNKYMIIILPFVGEGHPDVSENALIVKEFIKTYKLSLESSKDIRVVAVMKTIDAFASIHNKSEVTDPITGDFKLKVSPSEDKNAKDVVMFDLEEKFYVHNKYYEYIESADGSMVIAHKPIVDAKSMYNPAIERSSKLGYFFTEPQSQN
jgi:hypothetical protein